MGQYRADSSILALADDLSGAAETAYALSVCGRQARIELTERTGALGAHNTHSLLVKDLDSRHRSPREAAQAVRRALAAHTAQLSLVLLKVDSMLRGNVTATLRAAGDQPVVLAAALPAAGRTVLGGQVHIGNAALHETDMWQAEAAAPPESIAAALAPLPCRTIPLNAIRSTRLRAHLTEVMEAGETPVCDGVTDSDLDAVVAATADMPSVRLAGCGGLAAAVGRALSPASRECTPAPITGHDLLIVVGTADPGAREQVQRLAASRRCEMCTVGVDPRDGADAGKRLLASLANGPAVLTVDAEYGFGPSRAPELLHRLTSTAHYAVKQAGKPVDLVLTGGDTARSVLRALDIGSLTPIDQIHHGAVHSRTPDGTSVVTRPGSFGDADSLCRIVDHLRPDQES